MTTFTTKMDVALLLDSAVWPALLVDPAGKVRRANKAAIDLFGSVVESDSCSITSILAAEKPPAAERFLAELERSAAAAITFNFKGKDGATAKIQTSVCAFTREGEKRFLFQLHGHGPAAAPTQAGETETTPARKSEPKQKVDTATQLARSIALDLNNTLTSIMGHCSWILSHMEPDHKWRKSLEEIARATSKSADIAESLAAFSRSDKEKEAAVASNVNATLKRLQQEFRDAKGKPVEWVCQMEEQVYSARCDENKLNQVFSRVIENATESGAVQPRITVHTRNSDIEATLHDGTLRLAAGCYVCVEISDNGQGIPHEVLPRIFEPFFTTKPGHKGLGLAWVYGAITNAGGGVAVSSLQGQGTTVRLYIPAHKRVLREANPAPAADVGSGKTILLVDDEDLVLSLGQTVLTAYGYKILTATSAEQALKILAEYEGIIDLAIVDWIMPRISGRELMDTIRAKYPSVAIMCTSGYAHVPGTTGNTDFLQKPFTTQKLLQRVKEKLTRPQAAAA